MTLSKRLTLAVLCMAIIFCTITSVQAVSGQNARGGFSSAAPLSRKAWDWFAEQFGSCTSLPQLLHTVNRFAIENFTYEEQKYFLVQTFYPDVFLFQEPYVGMCYEFACFVKSAVLVWAAEQEVADVRCFVYCLKTGEDSYHAVNFICQGEDIYYIDVTTNNTQAKRGESGNRILKLKCSIDEFLEKCEWELESVH